MRAWFEEMTMRLGLGPLLSDPERVSGGYQHRMYRMETCHGSFAVKLLNPSIMKRPDAAENFLRAERLERRLEQERLPIVPAMEWNGQKMQLIGGRYFYVFPWVDGKADAWDKISAEHCRRIGGILARIHKIDRRKEMVERDEVNVDWAVLIGRAETECPELGRKLSGARGLLYEAQDMLNAAWRHMPEISCISNADMDSKNVLWADDEPLVIDLECLDYGQPVWDMFQLALSWSGGVLCNMDYDRLQAFIAGYREEGGVIDVDLAKLYGAGFSWLEWLEYNVGRAMGDGGIDKEEREMGLKEAVEALGRIEYYDSIKEELIAALGGRQ